MARERLKEGGGLANERGGRVSIVCVDPARVRQCGVRKSTQLAGSQRLASGNCARVSLRYRAAYNLGDRPQVSVRQSLTSLHGRTREVLFLEAGQFTAQYSANDKQQNTQRNEKARFRAAQSVEDQGISATTDNGYVVRKHLRLLTSWPVFFESVF